MIATALSEDGPEIIALWRLCGLLRPWNDPVADLDLALVTATSTVLVLRMDANIIASVMVGFDGHRGWVYYLAVAPAHQKCGFGLMLMGAAERWLKELGCPKIQLMVRGDNDAALGFYNAIGYQAQDVVTIGRRLDSAT